MAVACTIRMIGQVRMAVMSCEYTKSSFFLCPTGKASHHFELKYLPSPNLPIEKKYNLFLFFSLLLL